MTEATDSSNSATEASDIGKGDLRPVRLETRYRQFTDWVCNAWGVYQPTKHFIDKPRDWLPPQELPS
jgi:hypothetical protein